MKMYTSTKICQAVCRLGSFNSSFAGACYASIAGTSKGSIPWPRFATTYYCLDLGKCTKALFHTELLHDQPACVTHFANCFPLLLISGDMEISVKHILQELKAV